MDLCRRIFKLRPTATVDDFVLVDNGDGPFIEKWISTEITQPTQEEIASVDDSKPIAQLWAILRTKRNRLLAETDWQASTDLSITQEQKDYRQALRDLPANTADPTNITWPTEPS